MPEFNEVPAAESAPLMADVFGIPKPAAQATPPPAAPTPPVAQATPPVAEAVPAAAEKKEEAPAAPVAEATPAASDPFASLLGEATPDAPLAPEVISAFKSKYGIEDPDAHFKEYSTLKETLEITKNKAAEADAIMSHLNSLSPDMVKAIEEDRKRPGAGVEFLRNLPKADYSKPAADIDPTDLVEKYFPGKFTEEERDELKTKNPDEALKAQFERYVDAATMKHDGARNSWMEEQTRNEAAVKESQAKWQTSAAESYAHLKKVAPSMELLLTPEMRKAHESGQLYRDTFLTKEGFLKPESLLTVLKATQFDTLVARVKAGVAKTAHEKGVAEGMSRLPETPRPANGAQSQPKQPEGTIEQQLLRSILAN